MALIDNFIEIEISRLVKADWNYKEDDEFKKQKLIENIKRNGQLENIIIRELDTGFYEVVNGNHRVDAFIELNYTHIVAYNCGKISLAHAQRIAIETNETRFASNTEKLAKLIEEIKLEFSEDELKLTLPFTDIELADLLKATLENIASESNVETEEDDFNAEPPKVPITMKGDIYELYSSQIGNKQIVHRVMCGSSILEEDVTKLMNSQLAHMLHTDPPYNVKYAELNVKRSDTGKDWTDKYCTDWNDSMSDEDYQKFLIDFLRFAKRFMIEHAHYYVWHATLYYRELLNAFEINNIPIDKVPIQWVKQVAPLSWVRYKRKTEPCVFGGKGAVNGNGDGARWFGPNNENNVWDVLRDHTVHYIHPTQKPLALPARAIKNSSQPGEIVLELFGGSGSTMIAAEQLKRSCYVMELAPAFVDVIIARFIKYKINTSEPFKVLKNGEDVTDNFIELTKSILIVEKDVSLPDQINAEG